MKKSEMEKALKAMKNPYAHSQQAALRTLRTKAEMLYDDVRAYMDIYVPAEPGEVEGTDYDHPLAQEVRDIADALMAFFDVLEHRKALHKLYELKLAE